MTAHGGSPLSPYGRGAGGELTTFGGPDLYVAGKNWNVGASFRAIQIRRKTPKIIFDDYFLMQKEISGYVSQNGLTFGGRNTSWFVEAGGAGVSFSYRHAYPTFGLNVENHTVKTRRMWKEVDFLEAALTTDNAEVFLGAGRDFVSGKFVALFDWGRVALSMHSNECYGVSTIIRILEGLNLMAELNTEATFGKLSLHVINGVWASVQLDDLEPGVGLKWLPVRHLGFEALMEQNRYWVLGHLYF